MQCISELPQANEQSRQEAAIRRSVKRDLNGPDDRYRQMVEGAEDLIYSLTPEGHFTFVNAAAARAVRRLVEECFGMHFLSLIKEDFREQALEFYRDQIKEKIPLTYFELPLRSHENEQIWIGQNVQLVIQNGEVVELQAVGRDITQRKQIEQQLLESERRYRLLFESNPQPMWVFDNQTLRFLAVNDAAVIQYGYTRDEFLGMSIKDIRPAEDVPALFHHKAHPIDGFGGYDDSCRWRHRRKDGTILDVEITWHTLEFDGRPAKLVLSQNITVRRRAEAEAHFQQSRSQQLFENSPLGILQVNHDDRIVDANKEFQSMFQYSLSEIKGCTINDTIVPQGNLDEAKALSANTLVGETVKAEGLRERKDGTLVPVEIFGVPIVIDQKPVGVFAIYMDLTSRKRADEERARLTEKIEAQRQRLNRILSNVPCVVWEAPLDLADRNGFGRFVSSYVNDMLGYTVEEWQQPNFWYTTLHPDDRKISDDSHMVLFKNGQIRNELRWIKKSGDVVWGENHIILVNDEAGKPIGVRGVTTDITERKHAETALRASERGYRDIFTFAPVGIYQSLYDGTITAANNALAEMLGYESADELLQVRLDCDVYVGEQERQKLIEEYETRGYARDLEIRWKKKDGSVIWVELTAHAIKGGDGRTEYFEGFVHDITERKRMEDERQLISEIIQGVINTSDLNELLTLIHTSVGKYLYAENCFVALYDDHTKLMHFPFWVDKLDPQPEPRPLGIGFSSYVLRTGKPMLVDPELTELMYQRGEVEKSGSMSASWMGVPLRTSERSIGVLVVQHYEEENAYDQRDLEFLTSVGNQIALAIERKRAETSLREAEDRLRQSQKMESIGSLAGGIAHDFNNLMTAVTGYSELALRSIGKDDAVRFKIEEIKRAGERAAGLTRQLLAFSRKQMLQPRVLDLNRIISEMDKMLRRLIGEDMMLETLLTPALGQIKADPGQIEQILMNLVVNARDAMPTGGKLTIETRNAHIDQTYIKPQEILQPGHYVVLAVSDEGHGMDTQTQQKIFEPFFTTKDVGKGTGLGLATVYGIVKQSDGYIWVYSEPDKGTTFKIYLPRVDHVQELDETAAEREPVACGHETVLLVEDEQIVRDLAQEVLKQYGYTVVCAIDGEEGLRVCKEFEGRIDLMITDVVMPRVSGRELAEQVALLRPDTRVLYMSGFTDDAIVRHGLLNEEFAFMQKPFSPQTLATKARELLDR